MRSSLIAFVAAAAIAGIVAFLTEPVAGVNGGIPQAAVKGDRLDVRPAEGCSVAREWPYYGGGCVRSRTQPTKHRSQGRIIIVNRWLIELSPPLVAA